MNLLSNYEKMKARSGANSLRESALVFLNKHGLPTRKDENWKYTSTKVIQEASFDLDLLQIDVPEHDLLMRVKKQLNPNFLNVVFINGKFNDVLSSELPAGLKLEKSELKSSSYENGFQALNILYADSSWNLTLAKDSSVEKVVNIVYFTSSSQSLMSHPNWKIELSSGSSLKLIQSFLGDGLYLMNSATEIKLNPNSRLRYVLHQNESVESFNIAHTSVDLQAGAQLDALSFSIGAQLARHGLQVNLNGEGASATINGASVVQGHQHIDHNTSINHNVGHCQTAQLYKNILDGESKAVFNGRVYIAKDAQKANSEQLNNNLLLSSKSEVDTKPMLEIYADDVKAGHGSTVGQLNKEELFYLQSRCISKDQAIAMLSYGFISELLLRLENEDMSNWLKLSLDKAFQTLKAEA